MATAVFKNYNKFNMVRNIPSKIKGSKSSAPAVATNPSDSPDSDNPFRVWGSNNSEGNTQYNFAVDVIFSYVKPNGETAQALRTFNIFTYSVESAIFKATYFFHYHLKNLGVDFDAETTHLIEVNNVFIRLADCYLDANSHAQSYDLPYKTTRWYEQEVELNNSTSIKETPKYLFKYNCKLAQELDTEEICDILDGNSAKYITFFKYQDVIASSINNGTLEAKKRVLHKVYTDTNYKEKVEFRGVKSIYIIIDKNEYVGKIKTVFNKNEH